MNTALISEKLKGCNLILSIIAIFAYTFPLNRLHSAFLGSGPNWGRSPVEWGAFPSVRPSVRTYVHPPPNLRASSLSGPILI